MLEAIEKGQIEPGSTIIIESLDRLSRRGIDVTQQIIKSILQHNVFIASLVDGLLLIVNPSMTRECHQDSSGCGPCP
jgi:DNA invertase Pin-like site-specific DNA recombinase